MDPLFDTRVRAITPFDVYSGRWPDNLPGVSRVLVEQTRLALERSLPAAIALVVAAGYARRRDDEAGVQLERPDYFRLYIFGEFRSPYAAMSRVAESLAQLYTEVHILPLLTPIPRRNLRESNWLETRSAESIRREGIITYIRPG